MNNISPEHEAELDRRFADSVPAPMVQVPADTVEKVRETLDVWAKHRRYGYDPANMEHEITLDARWMDNLAMALNRLSRLPLDAATPAASVPAADILALADHEKSLRELWREAAEKRIEQGVDWPRIVLTLFADIDRAVQQADLWQDKAEIADHERQDWKRWCKEAGALRAAMETERDALATLVAAAEQPQHDYEFGRHYASECRTCTLAAAERADKGEAADTPRGEWECPVSDCRAGWVPFNGGSVPCKTCAAPAAPTEPLCEAAAVPVNDEAEAAWQAYARDVLKTTVPEAFPSTRSGFKAAWTAVDRVLAIADEHLHGLKLHGLPLPEVLRRAARQGGNSDE